MDTTIFDFAAERLKHHAGFDRLAARGTLRIAIKAAGLEPNNLTGAQLQVVFEKVMPEELKLRGVSNTVVSLQRGDRRPYELPGSQRNGSRCRRGARPPLRVQCFRPS